MAHRVYYEPLLTADLTGTRIYQGFSSSADLLLKTVKPTLFFKGDPALTDLNMKIYTSRAGLPGAVLATSTNVITKAQLTASDNTGKSEVFFQFNTLPLRRNLEYICVINGTGYTGTDSSLIGWVRHWDPIYRTGLTITYENLSAMPLMMAVYGSKQ